MSGCAECHELISAYLDGEATADETARMRVHLANCAECRETMEAYRRIGATVRSVPVVLPPAHLTSAIYSQTIDIEQRRLFLFTGRMRYPLAAAAAALLIFVVAGYMLFGGYQRSIEPTVADFEPGQHQQWPIHQPIEITFNKAMDRESVEDALAIVPAGEGERLDRMWDGNTLLIGGNQALRPGSSYTIKITTDARDKWGNRLDSNFQLDFTTGPTVARLTPTPSDGMPLPTATDVAPTPTPESTNEAPQDSTTVAVVETETVSSGNTPVAPLPSTPTPDIDTPSGGPTATGTVRRDPTPTSTPRGADGDSEPSMTLSPTPTVAMSDPTATPSPTPPAPTATEVPPPPTPTTPPTSTPTPEPVAPTPSPTPVTIPVTGVLGDVYWGNQSVQDRLGVPTEHAYTTDGQQLGFQRGSMVYRSDLDTIYVLVSGSSVWERRDNLATTYPEFEAGAGPGTWRPGGLFGALWESEQYLQDTLQLAVSDMASSFPATVQRFDHGSVLSAPGVVYIFYDDLTWEFWPASE